jgi:hypothetical protein
MKEDPVYCKKRSPLFKGVVAYDNPGSREVVHE